MTLSDLIDQLDALREQHGDLPVYLNRYRSTDVCLAEFDRTGFGDPEGHTPRGSVVIS